MGPIKWEAIITGDTGMERKKRMPLNIRYKIIS
jgi:hypothetical protein